MTVHPECRQSFLTHKQYLAHTNKGWTFEAVEEAAYTKMFALDLEDTKLMLARLAFCPGSPRPIEEFERYLQEEAVLDETLAPSEDEEI